MDDEFESKKMEEDLPEFTLAEIIEMEKVFKEMRKILITEEFCRQLSGKFNCSTYRCKKSPIKWLQVQNWFQDKLTNLATKVILSSPHKGTGASKTAIIKRRPKVPTISASEAADQLSDLIFEARSAKDSAWFDVSSFLTYRVLSSGELVVRVRFDGFGKEEDEWVSVRRAVRERSIPLEHSECNKVNVGDLVLCFREAEDHALYCDAHVVEIERKAHDSNCCTCIFIVRYDYDNVEGKVTVDKICCRPTKSRLKCGGDGKLVPLEPDGMQKVLHQFQDSQLN